MTRRNLKEKIRKFSKVVTAVIGIGMLYGGWVFVEQNFLHKPTREHIAIVNGEKIYKNDFEKEFYRLQQVNETVLVQKKQQLEQFGIDTKKFEKLPDEILREYLIKTYINRKVLISASKDLKVKVSGGDVNKQVEEIQKQSGGKERFIQGLTSNGYNLTTFKEELKNELIAEKVQEKIESSLKVSDEEMKKTYERYKYKNFIDQSYEEAKPQIIEILNSENNIMLLNSYIEKSENKAKIEFNDEEYKKLYENTKEVIIEQEGYKFTKGDLNQRVISEYFQGQNGYSQDLVNNIKEAIKNNLTHLVGIMKKAKEAGITSSPEFVGLNELSDYSKKYFNYLVDTYQPSETEIKNRFNTNKNEYNIQNTINGYVVGEDFSPSVKDYEKLKIQAEDLMKSINKENFAKKAKELSKDTASAVNGGKLGENVDITGFVPEFAEAIRKGKAGEIVGPVKTEFGYHIIYIESKDSKNENIATASHILLVPSISEETKNELIKKLSNLKTQLSEAKITWEQVNTQDKYNYSIKEQFKKITRSSAIPGIGNDSELSEKLFAIKIGETIDYKTNFGAFLIVKTKEVPFKEVTLDEVKERIRLEFAIDHANKVIGEIN